MHRRLNITLPEETIRLIDRASAKGDRSRLIDDAVKYFMSQRRRLNLRAALKEGAQKRARRDLNLAEDWFLIDDEPWHNNQK